MVPTQHLQNKLWNNKRNYCYYLLNYFSYSGISQFEMKTRKAQFLMHIRQHDFTDQLWTSKFLIQINTKQQDIWYTEVTQRQAFPLTVQRALPCSVCFFCHVPRPGNEVLTQIWDNRFSTQHLWAEDVG